MWPFKKRTYADVGEVSYLRNKVTLLELNQECLINPNVKCVNGVFVAYMVYRETFHYLSASYIEKPTKYKLIGENDGKWMYRRLSDTKWRDVIINDKELREYIEKVEAGVEGLNE